MGYLGPSRRGLMKHLLAGLSGLFGSCPATVMEGEHGLFIKHPSIQKPTPLGQGVPVSAVSS